MPSKNPLAGLAGRNFLTTDDLTDSELEALLELAARFKARGPGALLAGRILGMVFFNPSLRTRASFEAGMFQLGGHAIDLSVGQGVWKLEHRDGTVMDGDAAEHLREAVPVLARYCDLLSVRCFPSGKDWAVERTDPILSGFAAYSDVPVINMESSLYHPCQALADLLTIREKLRKTKGKRFLLTWCRHPRALPTAVPNSAALIASRAGMRITIARPPGFDLDPDIMTRVRANARKSGGSVEVVDDFEAGFDGANVVYAKEWGSLDHYGDDAAEKALRARHTDWMVGARQMKRTRDALLMHCLPVRRNVALADEVLDGPWSAVVDEAENRLHAQKALLVALAGKAGPKAKPRTSSRARR
ncbi:MAG: N-acetylornithine carbamoyltransferase [Candidatus Wallbacteria bacterium]|nr:N-acetylornithine carbamoyltransferase [Candidatus Wallbacteria bacterium]